MKVNRTKGDKKVVKKRYFLAMLLVATIMLSACSQQSKQEKGQSDETASKIDLSEYKNSDIFITPQELNEMLGDPNLIIFDSSKADVYEKKHIPGAIGVGWHKFSQVDGKPGDPLWGTSLEKAELKEMLESFGVTNDKLVVFTSNVLPGPGPDGRNVWQMRMAGLDNVKLLYGGNPYWEKLGYEMSKEVPTVGEPSTSLQLENFDESYRATKDYIYENLGKTVIIDVRTEKEYKGSQDAGEARGGHIEGAKNLLWSSLLNEDATPKSSKDIISMMAELGVKPEDDFVVY